MMPNSKTKKLITYLTRSAIIAALYAALTLIVMPIAYGPVQFRISEALTVLPFFLPEAIPGLFVGCIIANIFSTTNFVVVDIIVGSIATLIAAIITHKIKIKWLVPLPAVICNALIVGFMLTFISTESTSSFGLLFLLNMLSVGAGELVICYGLGLPLILLLQKTKFFRMVQKHE